jgi:photosystem II stability/assembly factor-like uncharacterized protein
MRTSFRLPIDRTVSALLLIALAAVAPAQNVWTSHGPKDIGWVNDLAIADSVAYAATLNGVFRSNDGGATWQESGLEGKSIFQIVARSGAAVVLATGYGFDGNLHASRNGGQTWAPIPGLNVTAVAIDPGHLSTLYAAAADRMIWRSADSGASWQPLSPIPGDTGESVSAFAFDSRAIYVLTYENLYKSLDGGVTWVGVGPPLGGVLGPNANIAAGAAPGVVYVTEPNYFCRSSDSAATWTCSTTPFSVGFSPSARILEIQGNTPSTSRLFVAAGEGGFVSRDGGATWSPVAGGLEAARGLQALGSDASGSLVLVGTDTQVFRSRDRGDSWTPSSTGLKSVSISALALDPREHSTVWAGGLGTYLSGPGLFRSVDSGLSWSPAGGPQGPQGVNALAIEPDHPLTMYAGSWHTVFRTEDGGQTWTSSVPDPVQGLNVIALDPDSPQRVWAGSHSGLFRSNDGARSWEPASIAQGIYSILFDDRHPGTIYAGSYFDVDFDYHQIYGGSIFVSHDHGASFTKGTQDFGGEVFSIVTDPFHDGVLYVAATSGGVFRSVDGGVTWESASAGLSRPFGGWMYTVGRLVADPVRPGRLYCSTYDGVFRTIDGAQTWQPFSLGLPSLSADPLVISPDGKRLFAGTAGGGVFGLDLATEANSFSCTPTATRLCLVGNRYAVELSAARRGEVPNNPGAARPLSDRAGYFGLPFATGDPDLPEVVVKMLADGAFGAGGAPLFYSSLTTMPYVLTVTDMVTGRVEVHASNPDTPLCGATNLFGAPSNWDYSRRLRSTPATIRETALQLLGGRFSVTLEARHPASGRIASGVVISSADRFGIFSLPDFTGDPQFPEVVVKMVDARSFTGKFWFFHTGLTSLDYTLTVTDSVTGAVRTYESATSFCGAADTNAFADSPASPSELDLTGPGWDRSRSRRTATARVVPLKGSR